MAHDSDKVAFEKEAGTLHHGEAVTAEVLASEAKLAAEAEHRMSLWQAIKTYPKAIGWSVLLSTTLIMEGYDLALLGNLYASPVFNKKFGTYNAEADTYQVSAAWQSGLSNGARAGEIIGLVIAGWTADRYGYKMTTIGSLVLMIAFVFVLFFAPNVKVLVLGEVLCGMSSSFLFPPTIQGLAVGGMHANSCRNSLGRLSECHSRICLRGCAYGSAAISHHIYQHVLGYRPILCCCCQQGLSQPRRSMGLPDPLWCSVGMASAHPSRVGLCARVSLPSLNQLNAFVKGNN